jgi:hypothetical protein
MHQAHLILKENETTLNNHFNLFFPELIDFVNSEIESFTT